MQSNPEPTTRQRDKVPSSMGYDSGEHSVANGEFDHEDRVSGQHRRPGAQTLRFDGADRHTKTVVASGPTVTYLRDATDGETNCPVAGS